MNRPGRMLVVAAALVFGLVAWVYAPARHATFLHWDDDVYLRRAWLQRDLSPRSIGAIFTEGYFGNYHPLASLSHAVDCRLFGFNPAGHHATSVGLHATATALVVWFAWLLLGRLFPSEALADFRMRQGNRSSPPPEGWTPASPFTRADGEGCQRHTPRLRPTLPDPRRTRATPPQEGMSGANRAAAEASPLLHVLLAAGVGLFFGLHPVQVESVAWVAERKNVLCGLFSIACLAAYLRAAGPPRRAGWWWTSVGLFLAALLSKPVAVSVPFVMLALDFLVLRRQEQIRWPRLLLEKVPLLAASLAVALYAWHLQQDVGAAMALGQISLPARVLVACRAVTFYAWKSFWPAWLSPFYPLAGGVALSQPEYALGLGFVLAVTMAALGLVRRAPAVLAGWASFLVLLAPVSGLWQIGAQAAADRYLYVPILGLALALAAGIAWCGRHWHGAGRAVVGLLVAGYLGWLAIAARAQVYVWYDDVTLWTAAYEYFPEDLTTLSQLGMALARQDRWAEAEPFVRAALTQAPDSTKTRATLGFICLNTGRYAAAARELKQAVARSPEYPVGWYNLAAAESRLGRFPEALAALERAVALNPNYAQAIARNAHFAPLRADPITGSQVDQLRQATGQSPLPAAAPGGIVPAGGGP